MTHIIWIFEIFETVFTPTVNYILSVHSAYEYENYVNKMITFGFNFYLT